MKMKTSDFDLEAFIDAEIANEQGAPATPEGEPVTSQPEEGKDAEPSANIEENAEPEKQEEQPEETKVDPIDELLQEYAPKEPEPQAPEAPKGEQISNSALLEIEKAQKSGDKRALVRAMENALGQDAFQAWANAIVDRAEGKPVEAQEGGNNEKAFEILRQEMQEQISKAREEMRSQLEQTKREAMLEQYEKQLVKAGAENKWFAGREQDGLRFAAALMDRSGKDAPPLPDRVVDSVASRIKGEVDNVLKRFSGEELVKEFPWIKEKLKDQFVTKVASGQESQTISGEGSGDRESQDDEAGDLDAAAELLMGLMGE